MEDFLEIFIESFIEISPPKVYLLLANLDSLGSVNIWTITQQQLLIVFLLDGASNTVQRQLTDKILFICWDFLLLLLFRKKVLELFDSFDDLFFEIDVLVGLIVN